MRVHILLGASLGAALTVAACSGSSATPTTTPAAALTPPVGSSTDPTQPGTNVEPTPPPGVILAAETQRAGNAEKGYRALVNEAYVPCGIPDSAYSKVFGAAPPSARVPGREGRNQTLPYNFTAMTTKDGVALVTSNCLTCHASTINGQVVVGLGAATSDFTQDSSGVADAVGGFVTDPKERLEWQKWKERVETIAPYSVLSTRGPNAADGFTAALFSHHDPKTMAWSATPLIEIAPPLDLPVDVPPWWRMKKKSSMFYLGAGRGDHARIMMSASVLCSSSVEEMRAIDAYFPDIRAWIENLAPPAYPFPFDKALAERGRGVFESTCSSCHGTYGPSGHYTTRAIAVTYVGTDPLLAAGSAQFTPVVVDWFKNSFFGELSRMEPQAGYVAPPLDGIWATAPFLHNGSVPTIEALLDSKKRPKYWTWSFDTKDFDTATLGWIYRDVDHGQDAEPNEAARSRIYDTTKAGYNNSGHTFGDALNDGDRKAVVEYLKTL